MGPKAKAKAKAKASDVNQSGDVNLKIKTLEDLKLNFQDVLDRDLHFKGSFAFQKTYKDFPNPCLNIKTLGHIGLPLSTRDAEAIISKCSQAPFGKGAETVVDKNVRNTWQLDSPEVSFENPKWKDFINGLVRDACKELGVDYDISRPACELYKLLVYEPGSHFKSHQDTEKSPGMFATMVVILPSKFTGGDVHLKHTGSSEVFKGSKDSVLNISALGWYTDVFHEIKPIKTGYRLALSYNLIHKSKIPKPVLPADHVAAKKLEQVFQAWADGKVKSIPAKLFYLLDHEYSNSGLKASGLKGVDAKKVSLMSSVGVPLGFKFALTNVEYYVLGCPEDEFNPNDRTITSLLNEEMKFGKPVDLDGRPITNFRLDPIKSKRDEFSDEDKTQFIPNDLSTRIRDGRAYNFKKEPYYGNEGGDTEVWYHRTILVIWHDQTSPEAESSGSGKRTNSDDATDDTTAKKRRRKT